MDGQGPLAGSFLRERGQVGIRCRAWRGTLEVGQPFRRGAEAGFEGFGSSREMLLLFNGLSFVPFGRVASLGKNFSTPCARCRVRTR